MSDADTRPPLSDPTADPGAGGSCLVVYVAFCADLPDRTGESAPFPDLGIARILGRDASSEDELGESRCPMIIVALEAPDPGQKQGP